MRIKNIFLGTILILGWIPLLSMDRTTIPLPGHNCGIIDLRNRSFNKKILLNGKWIFYWHKLVSPQNLHEQGGMAVDFPFRWDNAVIHGKKFPSMGYATFQTMVLLPPQTKPLRLEFQDAYSAYRLYVNGRLSATNGRVSTGPRGFVPQWMYRTVDIPENTDTLRLTLQVANFSHVRGGVRNPVIIGERDLIKLSRLRTEAIDLLLAGCLIMGGLFFLGLYFLGNNDNAILFFALFCMIYSYRVIGVDNYELHSLLPNAGWYLLIRLEYLTLFFGISLFGLYLRYLYPEDINKKIIYPLILVCLGFGCVTTFLPPLYFTQLIHPFLVLMGFCLIYLPFVYIRAYRNKRPGYLYSLISSLVLMPSFAISMLHYWDLIPPMQMLNFSCYISFFFLQSLTLSHRVSFALKKAKKEAEEALKAKGEFLSTMSHEIRTPLNSVIGMAHLLLEGNPRKDQKEQLEGMLFAGNNLLNVVNDILDYSKIEAGKISFEQIDMDLVAVTRNIIRGFRQLAQNKGIDLRLATADHPAWMVKGDPTRTSQVITNLVHNAIKFTKKGYVEVSIDALNETEKNITLKIQVKDTGIGIPKEKQLLIFERFAQADSSTSRGFGGTGLGLSICKRILELQGSSLNLLSEEGRGSSFFFIQTFEKSDHKPKLQTFDPPPGQNREKPFLHTGVLLVDDNKMNVMVARSFLERWGAHVEVASNGLEAVAKLDPSRHQLVLMDIHMPVMDGYEATRNIRNKGISTPIIALTADLPNETVEKARTTGMDDILVKPFVPDDLYSKVLHYIHEPRGEISTDSNPRSLQ